MIKRDNNENRKTIGSAAMECALNNARLVSFDNCSSIQTMMEDLKAYHQITDENFWIGIFAPGQENTRKSTRNFVEDAKQWIVDS